MTSSPPGTTTRPTATGPDCKRRSRRSRPSSEPARARRPQEPAHQVPPRLRQEPPQALARPLDLHPHRRRRADQQPRRTRPPRRRHLPQTLTRQPVRTRRTHDRTTPLRLNHLPAPQAVPLRLPQPSPRRPRPRRPSTRTHLTYTGLNAYQKDLISRDFPKPSIGLEPMTPSLPFLQIALVGTLEMRQETSRVSFLMCPFCVRVLLSI